MWNSCLELESEALIPFELISCGTRSFQADYNNNSNTFYLKSTYLDTQRSFPLHSLSMHTPLHVACVFATIALTSQSHLFMPYIWRDWTHFCPTSFSTLCPPCRCTDGIFLCGAVEQKLRAESLDMCQNFPLCESHYLCHYYRLSLSESLCVFMHVCVKWECL